MDGLVQLWNDVLSRNNTLDKSIYKCFVDQVQENISRDDAVALENHFKRLKGFRNDVCGVFRNRALLLLKSPSSKWTDPNIFAISNLLQNDLLNWRGDDATASLELISQSNYLGLLNIFPELLDYWFRKEFSDNKKKIPTICINWYTLLLTKLGTNKKNTSNNESNFIFSVFQQLDRMYPLLGQRYNVWRELSTIAITRIKGCSETQIFAATKLIAHIKRDVFKKLFSDIVKDTLNKNVQQINDQFINKIFIICDCKPNALHVPNS